MGKGKGGGKLIPRQFGKAFMSQEHKKKVVNGERWDVLLAYMRLKMHQNRAIRSIIT